MLNWIGENWGSLTVGLCAAGGIAAIIRKLVRDKKSHSCSCGCTGCPNAGLCHRK